MEEINLINKILCQVNDKSKIVSVKGKAIDWGEVQKVLNAK